jgi:hypothetical protein
MGQFQSAVFDPGQKNPGFIKVYFPDLQGNTRKFSTYGIAVQKQGFEG